MRRIAAAVVGLALVAAGCGDSGGGRETVRGVVLEVDGDLASVESFVLRTDEGDILEVVPAPGGDFRFPLPHLHDHRRTLEPVLVELDRSVDPPLATAIRDADSPAWHAGEESRTEHPDSPEPNRVSASEPDRAGSGPVGQDDPARESEAETPDEAGAGQESESAPDRPGPPPDATTAASTSTPPTTGPATEDDPEETGTEPQVTGPETEETGGPVIDLVIIDGHLDGGARRESVQLGDTVTLRVTGNSDGEIHVHGYDLFVHLVGGAGGLAFEASIPGVFEIKLEGSHTLLVRMEVS